MLKNFMPHQYWKLKPDGKIRITLTNAASDSDKSNYFQVAQNLSTCSELQEKYTLALIHLGKKYSSRLEELNMNPNNFKHTSTNYDVEVAPLSSEDLLLEGTPISNHSESP